MERSLSKALTPDANVGFGLQRWGETWNAAVGVFWKTYIEDADRFSAKESYGFNARFTLASILKKNRIVHIGTSFSYGIPDERGQMRIRTRLESSVMDERLISTGKIKNVDNYFRSGLEVAIESGEFSLQAEYIQVWLSRHGEDDNVAFSGGYLSVNWLINHSQKCYSLRFGSFGGVRLKKRKNVWELAVRQSFLDLNSRNDIIIGGKQTNTTWALNRYFNKNVRLMFNYIRIKANVEGERDEPEIFQMRLQWLI